MKSSCWWAEALMCHIYLISKCKMINWNFLWEKKIILAKVRQESWTSSTDRIRTRLGDLKGLKRQRKKTADHVPAFMFVHSSCHFLFSSFCFCYCRTVRQIYFLSLMVYICCFFLHGWARESSSSSFLKTETALSLRSWTETRQHANT